MRLRGRVAVIVIVLSTLPDISFCKTAEECIGTTSMLSCSLGGTRKCLFRNEFFRSGECVKSVQCATSEFMFAETLLDSAGNELSPQICRGYTVCGAGEFLLLNGRVSEAEDNVCSQATEPCSVDEYEAQTLGASMDRVCRPLTVCTDGQFVVRNATVSTDRQCMNRTQCLMSSQYISNEASPYTDNKCVDLTICASHKGETLAPTEYSDRKCDFCPVGFQADNTARTCRPCTSAEYSTQNSITIDGMSVTIWVCNPRTKCNAYLSLGTPTSDAKCAAGNVCPVSWRFDENTKLCSQCASGYYAVDESTCDLCPANHYCPPYMLSAVPCSNVTEFTYTVRGESVTFTLPSSPVGSTMATQCSCSGHGFDGFSETLLGCQQCQLGFYSNASSGGCKVCPDGHYATRTDIKDTVTNIVTPISMGCAPCPVETPFTHSTAASVGDCRAYGVCPSGSFWKTSVSGCATCSICSDDERVKTECSGDRDTECVPCNAEGVNVVCDPGSYAARCVVDEGGEQCLACSSILPLNARWSTGCLWTCDPGFFQVRWLHNMLCLK